MPWLNDLTLFRPVAVATGWAVALVLGLTGGVDRGPHVGAMAMTVAVGALVLYVFARTRVSVALLAGTVIGVPVSGWLLSLWWRDRGWGFPDEAWTAVIIGVLSAAVLGLWALADARRGRRPSAVEATESTAAAETSETAETAEEDGAMGPPEAPVAAVAREAREAGSRVRSAILWQGGLAVGIVLALGAVVALEPRAGLPEDAVVWTALAAAVTGFWLTVDAWGRTLLWTETVARQTQWVLAGRDAAVLLTFAAASRAWWQTAVPDDPGRTAWWNVQLLVLVLLGLGFRHVLSDRSLLGQEPGLDSATESGPETGGGRAGGGETGRRRPLAYFGAAAGVFTLAAFYVLANGTALMQLTVLLGFAMLVVLGLTRREQLFTWWGAVGVAVSVLWYLRGYTYVYLAMLGLVLIVLAVRQLRRHQARQTAESRDRDRDRG